jgi:threonine aldolase
MRRAIAAAPVGDDQYGEDPSVNRLQDVVAELLGQEAALWLPSGTMANQVAQRVLTRPGDEVIVSQECHAVWHETGGGAANAGVQFCAIGARGVFSVAEFESAIKPRGHGIFPPTTLVEIENTHNRAGGIVVPQSEVIEVCSAARRHGIASFLDGARLWNASVASALSLAELAAPFDLTAVSLSKGLGAPGGSLLVGRRDLVAQCIRHRRMLGGAMRQAGHYAAAGLYGIQHHLERLADDHANAKVVAEALAAAPGAVVDLASVQTNIVVFHLSGGAPDAAQLVAQARERGVLLLPFAVRTVRAVTHLDVSREQCQRAGRILAQLMGG